METAIETARMPPHQASAVHRWTPTGWRSTRPRMVSVTEVAGWFLANPRSHHGMVLTGTNALLAYVKNIRKNIAPLAASGAETASPNAAAIHETAATNSNRTPSAAASPATEECGRKPMPNATAATSKVDTMLRTRLAVTCPASTAVPVTSRDRNRSMMPPAMSWQTVTAVVQAPVTAQTSRTPGAT